MDWASDAAEADAAAAPAAAGTVFHELRPLLAAVSHVGSAAGACLGKLCATMVVKKKFKPGAVAQGLEALIAGEWCGWYLSLVVTKVFALYCISHCEGTAVKSRVSTAHCLKRLPAASAGCVYAGSCPVVKLDPPIRHGVRACELVGLWACGHCKYRPKAPRGIMRTQSTCCISI
jgi:hypothetical protein